MPAAVLTDAERERFLRFPAQIPRADLNAFFTLSASDRKLVPRTATAPNRIGFALQVCALRYLGFCPEDLGIPAAALQYVHLQSAQLFVLHLELDLVHLQLVQRRLDRLVIDDWQKPLSQRLLGHLAPELCRGGKVLVAHARVRTGAQRLHLDGAAVGRLACCSRSA